MSRLTIDITDEQHHALKAMAALEGKTLKQFALERLLPPTSEDARAWADLKHVIGQRIDEARVVKPPTATFDQIIADELGEP
jgi:hypothetical protein